MNAYYPSLKFLIPLVLSFLVAGQLSPVAEFWEWMLPVLGAVLLISVVWLVSRRVNSMAWVVGLYFLVFLSGMLLFHENRVEGMRTHAGRLEHAEVFSGTVKEISAKSDARYHRWRIELSEAWMPYGKRQVSGFVLVYVDSLRPQVQLGDQVVFRAELVEFPAPANPGDFDSRAYWLNQGVTHQAFVPGEAVKLVAQASGVSFWHRLNRLFHSVLERQLSGDELALAKGVLLGDKSEIRTEIRDAFSGAGAMHLLAVSGLHVGIFLVIIQFVFRKLLFRIPRSIEWMLIVMILWSYAGITGFSPSVNRAVLMFSFVALGMVFGKQGNSLNNLFVSALILLCINPNYLVDIGFQLSYLAMVGIFLFSESISRSVYWSNKWMAKLWDGTAVAIAAQLGTFPLTLYYFHQFPTYFLLTNLGLMVFSGLVLVTGLLTVTLSAIPGVQVVMAYVASMVLMALMWFIHGIHELPGSLIRGIHISTLEAVLIFLCMALFFAGYRLKRTGLVKLSLWGSAVLVTYGLIHYQLSRMSTEVVVLQANVPALSFKEGQQGVLLIYSNRPEDYEKFQFQRRALENHYGIPYELIQLPQKRGEFAVSGNAKWVVSNAGNFLQITHEEKQWVYVYRDLRDDEKLPESTAVVLGRWLSQPAKQQLQQSVEIPVWDLNVNGAFQLAK